ncbi:hypothetical protein [Sphingomonas alba]|uniref:Uncharacterized protein n=1 Tax=Sphingomonas alba TaxID=2908208 RepID=A0ABT0RNR1_9SPHN|nr:hypothetical protein [Sphingomonas alba]MCL6684112.1 hypothetical protein [Sphingomonas alba]
MRYKAVFSFGHDPEQTLTYQTEEDARHDVAVLSKRYAREHGSCHTQLFEDEQIILDLTETYYG